MGYEVVESTVRKIKKPATDQEKIRTNHMSDKVFVFKIYKEPVKEQELNF